MSAQQRISRARLEAKIGTTINVIVDAFEADVIVARSAGDAPEIDGRVYLPSADGVGIGDRLAAVVERADDYDLWARFLPR